MSREENMDLLVNLYARSWSSHKGNQNDVRIVRALAPDRERILDFVRNKFGIGWAGECAVALSNQPISCFLAVIDGELVGFACYDATGKGYFGPIGVDPGHQVAGVGTDLFYACMEAMRHSGYGYAVIGGGEGARGFYEKVADAIVIPGSELGIYQRMIGYAPTKD